jgi:hypothetical protein
LVNAYYRRTALKSGNPYALLCVGYGTDFLYSDGSLCYRRSHLIHVIDIYRLENHELVFNLDIILRSWSERQKAQARFKLLHYQAGILTVNVSLGHTRKLVVLDTEAGLPSQKRILTSFSAPRDKELLLRNNKEWLIIGVREQEEDGDKEWNFHRLNISRADNHYPERKSRPIEMCSIAYFATADIGTTVAIEIIDNFLWIITSEVTPDPEGKDPTSYYGGYRYEIKPNQTSSASNREFWRFTRRKQNEGPIHDLWTTLAFNKDENGDHYISETRREWLAAHPDDALRSFYTLKFNPKEFSPNGLEEDVRLFRQNLPDDDIEYVDTLLEVLPQKFFTNWIPHEEKYHREFPSSQHSFSTPPPISAATFTAPNTPYRYYDVATETFIELINNSSASSTEAPINLGLRTGYKFSETQTEISLWQPEPSSLEDVNALRRLLQPSSLRSMRAFHDERCMLFGSCLDRNSPIVLLTFDPTTASSRRHVSEPQRVRNDIYEMPVGEYPALWTREIGWWRNIPKVLQLI